MNRGTDYMVEYFTDLLFEKELRAIDVIVISVISTVLATIVISIYKSLISRIKSLYNKAINVVKKYYRTHIKHSANLAEYIVILEKKLNGDKLKRYEKKILDKHENISYESGERSLEEELSYYKIKQEYLDRKNIKKFK